MKAVAVICLLVLLVACSGFPWGKRGINEYAPVPDEAMVKRSRVSLEVLQTGHGVYMRKCGECHTHLLPDDITSAEWHVIVPGMAWNAGISPAEEKALLKYLIAANQTPFQTSAP